MNKYAEYSISVSEMFFFFLWDDKVSLPFRKVRKILIVTYKVV